MQRARLAPVQKFIVYYNSINTDWLLVNKREPYETRIYLSSTAIMYARNGIKTDEMSFPAEDLSWDRESIRENLPAK